MSTDGLRGLTRTLGAAPPASVAGLADAQLLNLSEAVTAARRRQAAELAAAGDQALRHIPKLLRVPLRKVLG